MSDFAVSALGIKDRFISNVQISDIHADYHGYKSINEVIKDFFSKCREDNIEVICLEIHVVTEKEGGASSLTPKDCED